jgi:hypothetical protein
MRKFSFWLFVSFFAAVAHAQSAHWEPSGGTLAFDQDNELHLVFDNCTPKDSPVKPPPVAGLLLDAASQGSSFSLTNGQASSSFTITYAAHPTKRGTLQLPGFILATDKGDVRVAAVSFDVSDSAATSPANGNSQPTSSIADAAHATLAPASGEYWAGEVFPIRYTLDLAGRYNPQNYSPLQWLTGSLIVEDWSKPEDFELAVNGERHVEVVAKTRGYAKAAGEITLPPVRQVVQFMMIDSFSIGFPHPVNFSVTSNAPAFTIKPLPPAPSNFSGAVGQFEFTAKVVPATVAVGEPVTWTIALTGTGNWPDITGLPAREASQDFQVVPTKPKRELKNGSLFDATLSEDAVLVPGKPGSYTLPPVSFTYFDPKAGSYKTLTTDGSTVTVTPAAENKTSQPQANVAAGTAGLSLKLPGPPTPPTAIPREPLDGTVLAPVPWSASTFTAILVAPFALLLFFWLGLALRRARLTDPRRVQREAYTRLAATLAQLRSSTDPAARTRLLLAWQHDTAALVQLHHAAPAAEALDDQTWQQLWRETEHALYAADRALPADWLARAATALAARSAPGFSPASLLLPRNLLPFAVALAVLFVGVNFPRLVADETSHLSPATSHRSASEDIAAYRSGDFSTAEAGWRDAIAQAPTNWIARHNLGLALAQQDRWPEAAAQWSAAFAQHPADDTLRWNLALGYEHAGYVASDLVAFTAPGPLQLLARLASPAEWQRLLAAAAVLAAVALALLLARGYGLIGTWVKFVALFALVLALGTAATAGAGIHAYGPAADARAAMVWRNAILHSIPTEAGTTQKTSPLAAGNLAVVDKTFLGWSRLVFDNSQTGWARTDDLVSLWK